MLIQSRCRLYCISHVVSPLLNHFTFNLKLQPGQPIPPSFTDLLKRMLHLDCDQRITPRGLLEHPFITLEGEIQTNSSFPEPTMVQPCSSSPEPSVNQPYSSCPEPSVDQPKGCFPEPIMVQPCSLPGSHTPSVSEEQREAPVDTTDSGQG